MKPTDPNTSPPNHNPDIPATNHDLSGDLSGDLSTFFPGFDPNRERAVHDPTYEEIDPEVTMRRDAVIEEEAAIPTYKNPLLKTGVVFAAVALLIGGSTALFLAGSNLTPTKQAENPVEKKAEFENPTVASSQLKGQIALDKQNEMLKGEKGQMPTTNPATPAPTPAATEGVTKPVAKTDVKAVPTKAKVEPVVTATPQTPIYKPTPSTPSPIARSYPLPAPIPIYNLLKPVARNRNDPKSIARPITPVRQKPVLTARAIITAPKPVFATRAVANTTRTVSTATRPFTQVVLQSWQQQSAQGTFGGRSTLVASVATPGSKSSAENVSPYLASESEIYGSPGQPPKTISIGAKSLGIILSPIQIAAGDSTEQIVTIGLDQPVIDRDGKVVIPAASQVQFRVSVLNNGWLRASSTKAYIDGREITIDGSFALTTDTGTPLVAQSLQFGEDIIAKQDQRNFILGALQNLGKVLTQPNTTSSTTAGNGGFSSNSSSTSNPNVVGAILDGGFSPLAAQQMTRSTAEINRLLTASRMWYLPVGTVIKITAVKSLRI